MYANSVKIVLPYGGFNYTIQITRKQGSCNALFGEGTPANAKRAFEYFSQMEKRADYMGRYLCICMYYFGIGVAEDRDKAHELLQHFHEFDMKQEEWLKECEERGYPWNRLKVETHSYWVYGDED